MIEISKKLLRVVGQTNAKYKMFEEGDKILLALSGGKDSMILSHILKHFSSVSPLNWEFHAVTVSYGIGENFTELKKHFATHTDIDYYIFGHRHIDLQMEIKNGGNKATLFLLGEWITKFTYGVFDGNEFKLLNW